MTPSVASRSANPNPIEVWDQLLAPTLTPEYTQQFTSTLRSSKLTFGDRIHCPFLRPFFLSVDDEDRVRLVAETIAALGERIVTASLDDPALLAQFHLRPEEERLARIPTGYGVASTSSRLDSFLLPDSLKFAEYNGEAPAGAGYSETLASIFREQPVMTKFLKRFDVHTYPLSAKLLDALVASYLDWGGSNRRPQIAIVDWKEVPTWTEFEILQARFKKMGVPTLIADPRELHFDGHKLTAHGKKIDLVYRRVLINDMIARPSECEALLKAYSTNSVCFANTLRCKIPHVKAFFAVLTDERNNSLFSHTEREQIANHIPWTRVVADVHTSYRGESVELLTLLRKNRENLVIKPNDEYGGAGVILGWETSESDWDTAIGKALSSHSVENSAVWVVQERIPVRHEKFPFITESGTVEPREMLVDFAPYLFRGKLAGFLTRLSSTGLANVTSGGGQVPAFRVTPKKLAKS